MIEKQDLINLQLRVEQAFMEGKACMVSAREIELVHDALRAALIVEEADALKALHHLRKRLGDP